MDPSFGDQPAPPDPPSVLWWLLPSQLADAHERNTRRLGDLCPTAWAIPAASIAPTRSGWVAQTCTTLDGRAHKTTAERATADEALDDAIATGLAQLEPIGMGAWWAYAAGDITAGSFGVDGGIVSRWGGPERHHTLDGLLAAVPDGAARVETADRTYVVASSRTRRAAVIVSPTEGADLVVMRWARAASHAHPEEATGHAMNELTQRVRTILSEPVVDLVWYRSRR